MFALHALVVPLSCKLPHQNTQLEGGRNGLSCTQLELEVVALRKRVLSLENALRSTITRHSGRASGMIRMIRGERIILVPKKIILVPG